MTWLQNFRTAAISGDFDRTHVTIIPLVTISELPTRMKLARPNVFTRASCWPPARNWSTATDDDDPIEGPVEPTVWHARWLSGRSADRETADLVILRGRVGLRRAARSPRLDHPGAKPAQRAGGGGVEQRQALPARPCRRGDRRGCRRRSSSRPRRFRRPTSAVRSSSNRPSAQDPSTPTGSSRPTPRPRMPPPLLAAGRSVLVQPYDERIAAGRPPWCLWVARESHAFIRARSCHRR